MSKRKKCAPSPSTDTPSTAKAEATAPWCQRFQLLDTCYCFLVAKKAIPSLNTIVSLATHMSGNPANLTATHVRQMVSIGVVELNAQPRDKVVQQDEFNPASRDPHETIELVQFPDVPQPSKRASTKRMLLFQRALQTTSLDLTNVPEFEAPIGNKRSKSADPSSPSIPFQTSAIPYLNTLMQTSYYDGQVVHIETIPTRPARFGHRQLSDLGVCDAVRQAVLVDKLYSHQSDAIAALLEGQHVVISTSTSSGKSMVYSIPVAHSLVTSQATSLFLFPTKALAQDQVQSFRSFLGRCNGLDPSICATYDGDTAMAARSSVRSSARVILTNPDMLHVSILPQHKVWRTVLSRLKYIVVDEAHMYRGIFGSHVANVLRRLFRLCYLYGSNPQVVCCSASIQNPREHFGWLVPQQSLCSTADNPSAVQVCSRGVAVLEPEQDGSPCGAKYFVVWRPKPPPTTSLDLNQNNQDMTGSTIFQSAQILATLVAAKVHTIAFCRGRKLTELILDYTHSILRSQKLGHLVARVKGYRGGYSVESRRAIETQLFRQELLGVVATNALELGIDIGSLECTLHLGFPPSIASMWQQAGRAGRSGKDSMAVIVCFDSPLDAYNTSLGSAMFHKLPEAVVLDPNNSQVVQQHLLCASLELDLLSQRCGTNAIDRVMFPNDVDDLVATMVAKGTLMVSGDGFRVPASMSVKDITIRDIAQDGYNVVDVDDDNKVIDTIPGHRVFFQAYPAAAYLHQVRFMRYFADSLDLPI
ncbi:hypothetical protein, variant [Aphanomyces invadans]|uniref:P-loop containing nucleoside triphosphate hydrolase protein n=1 Tax=Aphanomyces invadans TaxID=157072 RepID=A0A024UWK1_9STRA|nr:hypothetical protein, variant [Aphanomyces invadans]ETW10317.1 hypothetical protein, variant [Aphanomyces invadans]|eukprot:XP_008861728.1 hypothetical protein, variant [Aphanomyces invadans]